MSNFVLQVDKARQSAHLPVSLNVRCSQEDFIGNGMPELDILFLVEER